MKITLPAILAAALGTQTVLADYAIFYTFCGFGCDSRYMWVDAFGSYGLFDGNEGCRDNPGPPGMSSICFDWGNRRGHFFYVNQPKRCFKQIWTRDPESARAIADWSETPCTW